MLFVFYFHVIKFIYVIKSFFLFVEVYVYLSNVYVKVLGSDTPDLEKWNDQECALLIGLCHLARDGLLSSAALLRLIRKLV